jgi:ketosteroid isomerase-like protein
MKKVMMIVCAALILIASSAIGGWASVKGADEAAIRALTDRLTKAINAGDVDGVMACYVPDESLFVFDLIPPRQYVGAKAYRENWKGFLSNHVKADFTDLNVTVSGNVAYSHWIDHFVGTMGGKPFEITGRVTDVYRKIKGKWLIVMEHISVPVDPQTGKADLMSKP